MRIDAERVAAAALAAGDRYMVDPVSGKALIDKKSQKMQVKREQALWGLDTRIHHRSHDDQMGPAGDPDRECVRNILLGVEMVGEVQAGKTRPNGDALDSLYLEHGEAVGDLGHRRRGLLDRAQAVALGSHAVVVDSWGRGTWEDREAVRVHRRLPAALVVDRLVYHHVEAAWLQGCGDAGMRCGPARRLAPGRRQE